MSDRCCWPGCRAERACLYLGKPLCDKHGDLVQAEDDKVAARSRKKIGLPPIPTFAGRMPTKDEYLNVLCCFPGCESSVSLFHKVSDGERPFCNDHFKHRNEVKTAEPIRRKQAGKKKPEREKPEEEEEFDLSSFESRLEGGAFDWDHEE